MVSGHVDSGSTRAGRCTSGKLLLAAALLLSLAGQSPAEDVSQHRSVGGVEIYWGVLPAEVVVGHETEHGEGESTRGAHHLVVALYSTATGERVVDAEVEARVEPLGLAAETKPLETMTVNRSVSFGNYFRMPGPGPYRITVRVRPRGSEAWVETTFESRHGTVD